MAPYLNENKTEKHEMGQGPYLTWPQPPTHPAPASLPPCCYRAPQDVGDMYMHCQTHMANSHLLKVCAFSER